MTEPRDIEKDKAHLEITLRALNTLGVDFIRVETVINVALLYITQYEALKQENAKLKAFYAYWCVLFGQNLEVANWHQNGDTEPFDNFFNSAEELL